MLPWYAIYEDGTRINQFSDWGEIKFGQLEKDKIVKFGVGDNLELDLRTGIFNVYGEEYKLDRGDCERQLIYFRRNKINITFTGEFRTQKNILGFSTIDDKEVLLEEENGNVCFRIKK